MKWISVKDSLPDPLTDVIGVVHLNEMEQKLLGMDRMAQMVYRANGRWFATDTHRIELSVTHWMPMPELPEE